MTLYKTPPTLLLPSHKTTQHMSLLAHDDYTLPTTTKTAPTLLLVVEQRGQAAGVQLGRRLGLVHRELLPPMGEVRPAGVPEA